MFGFDGDDSTVFDETARFNIDADYDARAYSILTPYPGTLTWYELKKANRIVSFDWTKYDQANVAYRPAKMTGDQLRLGQAAACESFYVHEEGFGNRSEGCGGGAHARSGRESDAASFATEAGVAGGGARGDGGGADAVGLDHAAVSTHRTPRAAFGRLPPSTRACRWPPLAAGTSSRNPGRVRCSPAPRRGARA